MVITIFWFNFRSVTITCCSSIDGSSSLRLTGRDFYVDEKRENFYKKNPTSFYANYSDQMLNKELGYNDNQWYVAKDNKNFIYIIFLTQAEKNYYVSCNGFYSEFSDNSDYLCYLPVDTSFSTKKENFYCTQYYLPFDVKGLFQYAFTQLNSAFTKIDNNNYELRIYSKSQKKYLDNKVVKVEFKENTYITEVKDK